jgi:hypothetical protein
MTGGVNYGVYNNYGNLSATSYGLYNTFTSVPGGAWGYGVYNDLIANGSYASSQYVAGVRTILTTEEANDSAYGTYTTDDDSGGGTVYGHYIDIDDPDSTNYSIFVESDSGISYFGSNVGVGTSSPTGKLEVEVDSAGAVTALLVDQDDLDQIGLQIVQAADATANALDVSSLQVSGDVVDIDWSTSETQQGAITGLDVDFTNFIDDNASTIYGVHVNDFNNAGGGAGTQYGLYVEGTNWDYGVYSATGIYASAFTEGGTALSSKYEAKGNKTDRIFPEYPGAVIMADGSDNTGVLTSDMEVHNTNYRYNYYEWTTSETSLQDYDIYVKWQVPANFNGFPTGTNDALIVDLATESTDTANNKVDVALYEDNDADTTSDTTTNVSDVASNWMSDQEGNAVVLFDETDTVLAGLTAGDVLVIKITLYSKSDNYARAGGVTINWKSN